MTQPVLDRFGRSINAPQQDPIVGVLYPCYFSVVAALAGVERINRGESAAQELADRAMEIALAACAKIGITITAKNREETQ